MELTSMRITMRFLDVNISLGSIYSSRLSRNFERIFVCCPPASSVCCSSLALIYNCHNAITLSLRSRDCSPAWGFSFVEKNTPQIIFVQRAFCPNCPSIWAIATASRWYVEPSRRTCSSQLRAGPRRFEFKSAMHPQSTQECRNVAVCASRQLINWKGAIDVLHIRIQWPSVAWQAAPIVKDWNSGLRQLLDRRALSLVLKTLFIPFSGAVLIADSRFDNRDWLILFDIRQMAHAINRQQQFASRIRYHIRQVLARPFMLAAKRPWSLLEERRRCRRCLAHLW